MRSLQIQTEVPLVRPRARRCCWRFRCSLPARWPAARRAAGGPRRPARASRRRSALVRVTVVVRDASGALVRGLEREDFSITEDDKPQAIESFDFEDLPTERTAEPEPAPPASPHRAPAVKPTPAPSLAQPAVSAPPGSVDSGGRRLVVLLFDTNGIEPEQLERGVTSARSYVARAHDAPPTRSRWRRSGRGSGCCRTSPPTARRCAAPSIASAARWTRPTRTADPGSDASSDADAFAPDTGELDLFDIDRRLRAIEDLAKALAPVVQKKSVVYFSGGVSGAGADNQVELRAAIDRAVKANLVVYPVDVRGLEAIVPGGDARQASAGSSDVFSGRATQPAVRPADRLAGHAGVARQPTPAAAPSSTRTTSRASTSAWSGTAPRTTCSATPARTWRRTGSFRRLKVRVNRPDLRVEHRSGYYAERDFRHAGREDREQPAAGPAAHRHVGDGLSRRGSSTGTSGPARAASTCRCRSRCPGSALPVARSGNEEKINARPRRHRARRGEAGRRRGCATR